MVKVIFHSNVPLTVLIFFVFHLQWFESHEEVLHPLVEVVQELRTRMSISSRISFPCTLVSPYLMPSSWAIRNALPNSAGYAELRFIEGVPERFFVAFLKQKCCKPTGTLFKNSLSSQTKKNMTAKKSDQGRQNALGMIATGSWWQVGVDRSGRKFHPSVGHYLNLNGWGQPNLSRNELGKSLSQNGLR